MGIDIGQGAVKVTALDHDGQILGLSSEEYPTYYPKPGWSEQNPQDWIDATGRACRGLFAQLKSTGKKVSVEGVGLTSATHNAVLLDQSDCAVRRCIMLTDGRSASQAHQLDEEHGSLILKRTRNQVSPTWTLPQLMWVAENEPGVWMQIAKIAFAKDYVRMAMTGQWATDWIDAEGSLFFNTSRKQWDPDICELISMPVEWLPPLLAPTDLSGYVTREGEKLTGILAGTPVVTGCSDTAAEGFAAGACTDGQAVIKLATAGNVNLMTSTPRPSPEWFTYSHPIPSLSYHSLATNSAASSKRWFREILSDDYRDIKYADMDKEASEIPAGSGGLLFHPYLLGERSPYWNPDLRASFVGLSAAHKRGHMIRAILEGVAFSLADCLEVFKTYGFAISEARIIGGGAQSSLWRNIVSNVLGIHLQHPSLSDASAGAALLAGVGVDTYSSPEEAVDQTVQIVTEETPDIRCHKGYVNLLEVYRDVQRRLAPVGPELSKVRFQ